MTTHTLGAYDARLTGGGVEDDGLMTTIATGGLTTSAAHTNLTIDLGIDDGLTVEVGGHYEGIDSLANQVGKMTDTPLDHIALKTQFQVVDDAIAILHDSGAHLDIAAAQLDELQGVAPRLDAANAAELDAFHLLGLCHLENEAQGNGLDGASGIARDGTATRHLGQWVHGDGLDGVDGGNGIGTCEESLLGRAGHVGDVRRHLGNDGYLHRALHISGIELDGLGVLAHVATHAGKAHLRTREIELDGIDTGLLSHEGQLNPLLLGLSHDAGNNALGGIVLLETAQDVEIDIDRILAQLLHVAETIEVALGAVAVEGVETGRHLLDVLQADGLIEHTAPAGLKGARYHLVVGADGRGGEEEGILARDATEVDVQVGIVVGRNIVGTDGANQFLDADRPVVVDTGLLGSFQVGIGTVGNPFQGGLVVVETDGADGSCWITRLTCLGAGRILAEKATVGLFVDVDSFHMKSIGLVKKYV